MPTLESSSNFVQKLPLLIRNLEVPHSNAGPVTLYPEVNILHRLYIYLTVWNLKIREYANFVFIIFVLINLCKKLTNFIFLI
jgi:hypothetical protein